MLFKKIWIKQLSISYIFIFCRNATLSSFGTGTPTFNMSNRSSKQVAHGRIQCCRESWRRHTCHQNRVGFWPHLLAAMSYTQKTVLKALLHVSQTQITVTLSNKAQLLLDSVELYWIATKSSSEIHMQDSSFRDSVRVVDYIGISGWCRPKVFLLILLCSKKGFTTPYLSAGWLVVFRITQKLLEGFHNNLVGGWGMAQGIIH